MQSLNLCQEDTIELSILLMRIPKLEMFAFLAYGQRCKMNDSGKSSTQVFSPSPNNIIYISNNPRGIY